MAAITIGLVNAKGGVSKTMSTLNLAVELSRRAGRVLMVDFDPQSSLTQTLSVTAEEHNMAEVPRRDEQGEPGYRADYCLCGRAVGLARHSLKPD